ncbi:hypothetical protein CCMA1212_008555 [Trichoderma ghanense]|uniref:Uncharacterized protein n=1 Tax=Trichoderma ghanense TaxID=65468 RepID=A0ABY2GXE2_9HYPO
MPRKSENWTYTRTWDFAQDQSLQLGQILAEPKDPAHVLQPNGPLKFHDGMKAEHSERLGFSMRTDDELFAHFRG